MATNPTTIAPAPKPKFINRNAKVAGKDTINGVILTLKDARAEAQETAMGALGTGDRKGVLVTMKVDGTYARAISSLERALARAQRVRLSKEQKAAYELNGALPEGYEVVTIEDDDDEDDDIDAAE